MVRQAIRNFCNFKIHWYRSKLGDLGFRGSKNSLSILQNYFDVISVSRQPRGEMLLLFFWTFLMFKTLIRFCLPAF